MTETDRIEREEFKKELGARIRNIRLDLGMTQDELAEAVGYKSRSSVNKIEKGGRDITRKQLLQFANALHTTPQYLMGWTAEEERRPAEATPFRQEHSAFDEVRIIRAVIDGEPVYDDKNKAVIPAEYGAECAFTNHSESLKSAGIKKGDLVFIRERTTVNNGDLAAVLINDSNEYILKRIYQYPDRKQTILTDDNGEEIFTDQERERLTILGRVVCYLSSL